MVSCAPGAKATTTSAIRNGSSVDHDNAKMRQPPPRPRTSRRRRRDSSAASARLVLANRAPATAPSVSTAALPATTARRHGSVRRRAGSPSRPWRRTSGRPGNRIRSMARADSVETATSTASSASEAAAAARVTTTGSTVDPNNARPAGRPSTISSTRITCTIAIPRRSAPNSADSAITCAIDPGLAPSKAESESQPCTKRR